MSNGITAKLVWDGGDEVRIPEEMGVPRADQMQGTAAERLSELAGRVCYDSLGKGRPSFSTTEQINEGHGNVGFRDTEGYHDHILAVVHGSVLEHYNFTIEFHSVRDEALCFLNHPGAHVDPCYFNGKRIVVRATVNLRTVLDWNSFECLASRDVNFLLYEAMRGAANHLAPHIIQKPGDMRRSCEIVAPINDNERWISLYLSGSRGFSHEMVRHGDFTAISQRSTRYVDEDGSDWIEHPLIAAFRKDHNWPDINTGRRFEPAAEREAKIAYRQTAHTLEAWLLARNVDKQTARKQARGAARGYLGNALQTEMIFSASVAQWKRMIRQRASVFADAEIREVFTHVVRELKASRYAESFSGFELQPSPDGIGMVAVERDPVTAS